MNQALAPRLLCAAAAVLFTVVQFQAVFSLAPSSLADAHMAALTQTSPRG